MRDATRPFSHSRTSSDSSPCRASMTASSNLPVAGSPVRENAMTPAFPAFSAPAAARAAAAFGDLPRLIRHGSVLRPPEADHHVVRDAADPDLLGVVDQLAF